MYNIQILLFNLLCLLATSFARHLVMNSMVRPFSLFMSHLSTVNRDLPWCSPLCCAKSREMLIAPFKPTTQQQSSQRGVEPSKTTLKAYNYVGCKHADTTPVQESQKE